MKAAPMAAPLLWYNSDTACIIWEAKTRNRFFCLYLLHHDANEGFFSCGNRNSKVQHLAEVEKNLELQETLDSRSIKIESWFVHFSMVHFDTEKDNYCFSLTEKKMFTKSHAPKVEGYPQHHGLCFMKNSAEQKWPESWPVPCQTAVMIRIMKVYGG